MKQKIFEEWARHKYSEKQRIIAVIPAGLLFVAIIPFFLVRISSMDTRLGMDSLIFEPFNLVIGIALVAVGTVFAAWSNHSVFIEGQGTPVPFLPTQKLLVSGPFRYCRNPMAFGTICYYLGIVFFTGSPSSLVLFLILVAALLIYIKRIEEKELQARFGQEYIDYKKRVSFIIPH